MKSSSPLVRASLELILWRLLSCFAFAEPAGSGVVEGRVADANSGNYLRNARVIVEGTKIETLTNDNGEYRLTGAPAGGIVVRASFAGIGQQTAHVTVVAGQTVRQDFNL